MGVLFVFASVWSGGVLWLLYEFCVCSACGYAGRGGPCAGRWLVPGGGEISSSATPAEVEGVQWRGGVEPTEYHATRGRQ